MLFGATIISFFFLRSESKDVCPNGADHPPAVGKWDFLQETVPSTSDLWAAYRVCQGPRPVAKMQNKWIQAGDSVRFARVKGKRAPVRDRGWGISGFVVNVEYLTS